MAKRNSKPAPAETTIDIVDGAYELVNMPIQKISTGFGEFDLETLTEAEAEKLIKNGCKFIRKK